MVMQDDPMFSIRQASIADEKAVFLLASQLSSKFVVNRAAFKAAFQKLVNEGGVYLRVVETSGQVVAYLLGWCRTAFYSNGPVGWVQEVVVLPSFRRRGLGRQLMHDFEKWISEQGGGIVSLAASGSKAFYVALGYAESASYFKKAIVVNQPPDSRSPSVTPPAGTGGAPSVAANH